MVSDSFVEGLIAGLLMGPFLWAAIRLIINVIGVALFGNKKD